MEATLSSYNPTWRDKLATWMMGDGKASPERRAFVGGLLGSTGLGNTGVGVVDATPAGGLLGLQEAAQSGDKVGMAANAAGVLPVGKLAMFLGAGAKIADKVALSRAEKMLSDGASREDIWDATGWFKGVDGQWRFEIPDNNASVTEWTKSRHMPASVTFMERQGKTPTAMAFNDYIEHPELDRNYWPISEDAPNVFFKQRDDGVGGSYHRDGDIITISVPYSESKSTALHEVQHAIQAREGFARGGNQHDGELQGLASDEYKNWLHASSNDPLMIEAQTLANSPEYNRALQGANRLFSEQFAPRHADIGKRMMELPRQDPAKEALQNERLALTQEFEKLQNERFPQLARLDELADQLRSRGLDIQPPMKKTLDPYEAYRRLAGEVEARTTQKRMNMTAQERKARAPWLDYDVPEDKQIVRGLLSK